MSEDNLISKLMESVREKKFKKIKLDVNYKPTLYDVVKYFHNVGQEYVRIPLIGEEKGALSSFVAFVLSKTPVLIKSYSGTGKTILIDCVLSLIPEEDRYSIQMGSGKAIWYQGTNIKSAKYIEFPELQKAAQNLDTIEVMKNWAEDKVAKRGRTDMIATVESGVDTAIEQTLEPKPFITSFAVHNKDTKLAETEEFMRRVVRIYTDPSRHMTQRVIQEKLKMKATPNKIYKMKEKDKEKLQNYVAYIITKNNPTTVVHPGIEAIEDAIPKEFPIARSLIDYYFCIADGVTRFYSYDRIKYKKTLFGTPQDLWEAWQIYGDTFVESCLQIPLLGSEIVKVFPEKAVVRLDDEGVPLQEEMITEGDIFEKLKSKGHTLERGKIRKVLRDMVNACLIERWEEKKPYRYYRTSFSAEMSDIDWVGVTKKAIEIIKSNYSDISSEYIKRFCDTSNIKTTHPTTGKEVDIYTHNVVIPMKIRKEKDGLDLFKNNNKGDVAEDEEITEMDIKKAKQILENHPNIDEYGIGMARFIEMMVEKKGVSKPKARKLWLDKKKYKLEGGE
jgi:hypothetical protein